MTLEQLAIILEGVSFFFVTLDLFGKERLERFHAAVENRIVNLKDVDFRDRFGRFFSPSTKEHDSDATYGVLFFIAVIPCIAFYTYTMWQGFGWWLWKPLLYGVGTGILVSYFLGLLLFFIIIGVEYALDAILGIGIWILKRSKLEGVLLVLGTLLFLVSKAISYVNAA